VKKPKVLMLTGSYYPEISGGGLQARALIQALRDEVDFHVLTSSAIATEHTEIDGVPVSRIYVDLGSIDSRARKSIELLQWVLRFVRAADVVHFQGFSRKNIVVAAVAKALGRPIVMTLQTGGHDDAGVVRARTTFGFWSFRAASVIVAVSEALRDAAERAGIPRQRLRTVPNGVDVSRFHPVVTTEERDAVRDRLELPTNKVIILFVGFFSREKGPHTLFDAWKRLPETIRHRTVLLYIGQTALPHGEVDPALAPAIREESSALGATPLFVERTHEIESYYRAADVFVLPSTREGCSNALLEAMATGLPVISSRLPGSTDFVRDGVNGRLVPPGDVDALSGALEDMVRNAPAAAALGRAARDTVCQQFALGQVGRAYGEMYHVLAGEGAAS
jgi:glycosyltransferase involved in cell wall biosynthesis